MRSGPVSAHSLGPTYWVKYCPRPIASSRQRIDFVNRFSSPSVGDPSVGDPSAGDPSAGDPSADDHRPVQANYLVSFLRDDGALGLLVLLGLSLLLFAACETPPPDISYERAQSHEAEGRFQQALYEYRRAAQDGHAGAMHRLADVLRTGTFMSADGQPLQFVGRDTTEAQTWYRRARQAFERDAKEGIDSAQVHLGELLYYGYGGTRDTSAALRWWRQAAETGNPEARYRLAVALFDAGELKKAAATIRPAAHKKHAASEAFLAFLLQDGYGTSRDPDSALYWLRRAAAHGDSSAIFQIEALENAPATTERDSVRPLSQDCGRYPPGDDSREVACEK